MTQSELGNKVGLQKSTISEIENGKKDAGKDSLSRIALELNCSVEYLLGKTDEKVDLFSEILSAPKHKRELIYKVVRSILDHK